MYTYIYLASRRNAIEKKKNKLQLFLPSRLMVEFLFLLDDYSGLFAEKEEKQLMGLLGEIGILIKEACFNIYLPHSMHTCTSSHTVFLQEPTGT